MSLDYAAPNIDPVGTDEGNIQGSVNSIFSQLCYTKYLVSDDADAREIVAELMAQNHNCQKGSIVVGTFDWSAEAIALVKQNTVQLSYGGHFMEAGWVLVLAHDYLKGIDFVDDMGGNLFRVEANGQF